MIYKVSKSSQPGNEIAMLLKQEEELRVLAVKLANRYGFKDVVLDSGFAAGQIMYFTGPNNHSITARGWLPVVNSLRYWVPSKNNHIRREMKAIKTISIQEWNKVVLDNKYKYSLKIIFNEAEDCYVFGINPYYLIGPKNKFESPFIKPECSAITLTEAENIFNLK